jgi:hypothetical protein
MAEGHTRMIVFFGTEQQRQHWVREKNLDDRRVLLAHRAFNRQLLYGLREQVDPWVCSGTDGLDSESRRRLLDQIHTINQTLGRGTS